MNNVSGQNEGRFSGGFYSEHGAASILGVGIGRLNEFVKAGNIRTIRDNGHVLYSKQDVRALRDDPSRQGTPEEAMLDRIFRGVPERGAERESMARENGHVVTREKAARNPGETAISRMQCTCGWASPWLMSSDATAEKRAHLKDAAIGL